MTGFDCSAGGESGRSAAPPEPCSRFLPIYSFEFAGRFWKIAATVSNQQALLEIGALL